MPMWRNDGGFDRRYAGGFLMILMVILIPILFVAFGASLLFLGKFLQNLAEYDLTLIGEIIKYVLFFTITIIFFGISFVFSVAYYKGYKIVDKKRIIVNFSRLTTFVLFIIPLFGISILISIYLAEAFWSFVLMDLGHLELFGWVSIAFYAFSIHSMMTKIIPIADYDIDISGFENIIPTITCSIFFFVVGFIISLFAKMPTFYVELISS
jgi:hypothetical protein